MNTDKNIIISHEYDFVDNNGDLVISDFLGGKIFAFENKYRIPHDLHEYFILLLTYRTVTDIMYLKNLSRSAVNRKFSKLYKKVGVSSKEHFLIKFIRFCPNFYE